MNAIKKYFPEISEIQHDNFLKLDELYRYWNERINVISRKDIEHLYVHHVLHSLSIAKLITFKPGTRVIDVGTGGGFPGIPLAIFFPDVEFLLVDSIGKKITVVQEIATALKLENVTAVKCRAEEVDTDCDFVVSRAVASISELYHWTRHLVQPGGVNTMRNGWFFLKGGDLKAEIQEVRKKANTFDISNFFKEEYFETKKVVYLSA
jgi:16S rRNA (guanine527-N7)-methyltransferase